MIRKEARVTPLHRQPTEQPTLLPPMPETGARIGQIVAVDAAGLLTVAVAPTQEKQTAKLAVAADAERVRLAIESRQPVVLAFENGDTNRPIVIGFVEPPLVMRSDSELAAVGNAVTSSPVIEADVDGRRVRVTAQDEIVLECGAASITLRRNGRVVIRGTHVESQSEGTNRIKGGQVRIN